MVIPGKILTNFLDLWTKRSNKKQKARFSIIEITNQYFSNFLNKFNNPPHLGYTGKQVCNEPTKAYLCLINILLR